MTAPTHLPLLLLPGMDGTDALLGPIARALAPDVPTRAVTYPARGGEDYERTLPLVRAAVADVGPCVVLGWSFSGPLAIRVAAEQPDAVRAVVLAASFATSPLPWLRWTGPLLCTPPFALLRTLRRLPIWLLRPPADPLRRAKARIWREVPASTLVARARAIRRVDARAELSGLRQPLLYLQSARDRVVGPHNLARIRALRPDTEVATLPGDHFALFAEAATAAAAIRGFLRAHAAR